MGLTARDATAWLTEACAPWPCNSFLRIQLGEAELSLRADDARPVIDALSALLVFAASDGKVIARGPEPTQR
ncbi:hypothetical protein Acsp02_79240 [Actinoplanes sp. NBRC 103695]|nr:hypothetical protein Acsp02_79240 [Actinoplanes sp. NBRC 103695]